MDTNQLSLLLKREEHHECVAEGVEKQSTVERQKKLKTILKFNHLRSCLNLFRLDSPNKNKMFNYLKGRLAAS